MSVFPLSGIIMMVNQALCYKFLWVHFVLKKIRVSVLDAGFWIFFVSKACEVKGFWFNK
jgi:hypothetical protein